MEGGEGGEGFPIDCGREGRRGIPRLGLKQVVGVRMRACPQAPHQAPLLAASTRSPQRATSLQGRMVFPRSALFDLPDEAVDLVHACVPDRETGGPASGAARIFPQRLLRVVVP